MTRGTPTAINWAQELGSDSGDIVRHRAFYIFDRSIPVGFVRGQDINHEKAVLLKQVYRVDTEQGAGAAEWHGTDRDQIGADRIGPVLP